jgi:hypothetical protein
LTLVASQHPGGVDLGGVQVGQQPVPAVAGGLGGQRGLVEAARAGYRAASDDWGITLSTLVRGSVAAGAGDVATAAAMIAQGRRQAEAIGYGAFQPPALLFEAWVAEQRNDWEAAAAAYRRAVEVSGGVGFRDHASVALSGLGAIALPAATWTRPKRSSARRWPPSRPTRPPVGLAAVGASAWC